MLNSMRRMAGGKVAAVLIGLLALSFAVWGIQDVFRGFGTNTVASVGDEPVSTRKFYRAMNLELGNRQRTTGRRYTFAEAGKNGISNQVLGSLITEAALNGKAGEYQLGVSDDQLAKIIQSDPILQITGSTFNRRLFQRALRNLGINEDEYVLDTRERSERNQIIQAFTTGVDVPNGMLELYYQYQNEERSIDYTILKPNNLPQKADPTEDELKAYFEKNKTRFKAPEYRKIVLINITPEDAAKLITISDKDAKQEYEARVKTYTQAEKRAVEQVVFIKPEEAEAAKKILADGGTFEDVLKSRKIPVKDASIGLVTEDGMASAELGKAAFALKKAGDVTDLVKGPFGQVLLRVTEIQPGKVTPFDDVKADIKKKLAIKKAEQTLLDLHDKIEDERAGGATFEEIAKKFKLTLRTIDALSASGLDPKDKAVADLPNASKLLKDVFDGDVGVESDPIQVGRDGYAWFEIREIIATRDRTFAEAKDRVLKNWRTTDTANRMGALTKTLVDRIKKGESLAAVAKDAGLTVTQSKAFKRTGDNGVITRQLAASVFANKQGAAASAAMATRPDQMIFVVRSRNVPAFFAEAQGIKEIRQPLQSAIVNDLMQQYVVELRRKAGVTINQGLLRQILAAPNS